MEEDTSNPGLKGYLGPHFRRCLYCHENVEISQWNFHLAQCKARRDLENFISFARQMDVAECPFCGAQVIARHIHHHLVDCAQFRYEKIAPSHRHYEACPHCGVLVPENRRRVHHETAHPKTVQPVEQPQFDEKRFSPSGFFRDEDGELNFGGSPRRSHGVVKPVSKKAGKQALLRNQKQNPLPPKPADSPSLPTVPEKPVERTTKVLDEKKAISLLPILPGKCPFCGESLNDDSLLRHFLDKHGFVAYLLSIRQIPGLKSEKAFFCAKCNVRLTLNQARAHWIFHVAGIPEARTLMQIEISEKKEPVAASKPVRQIPPPQKIAPIQPATKSKTEKPALSPAKGKKGSGICPKCGQQVQKLSLHLVVEHPWCPYCKKELTKAEKREHFEKEHGIIL